MQTIDELRSKAAELRKIADKLDAAAGALSELGGSNGSHPAQQARSSAVSLFDLGDLSQRSGIDAILAVMRDMGVPLTKSELAEQLKARGKAIADGTLMSYLSREKAKFKSFGNGKWGLTLEASQ